MSIDKINSISKLLKISNNSSTRKNENSQKLDKVEISSAAKQKYAEEHRMIDIIKNAPDIRQKKVNELKSKIANNNYINDELINELAERIINSF